MMVIRRIRLQAHQKEHKSILRIFLLLISADFSWMTVTPSCDPILYWFHNRLRKSWKSKRVLLEFYSLKVSYVPSGNLKKEINQLLEALFVDLASKQVCRYLKKETYLSWKCQKNEDIRVTDNLIYT